MTALWIAVAILEVAWAGLAWLLIETRNEAEKMSRGYCGACGELFDDYAACGCQTRDASSDLYNSLRSVLDAAFDQASQGKGRERHSDGEPFEQQICCQITRRHGLAFATGQASKKLDEAHRLLRDKGPDAAIAEILGAINYAAAAVIVLQGQVQKQEAKELLEIATQLMDCEQSTTQARTSGAEIKDDIHRINVPVQEDSGQSATINRDSVPSGYENGQPVWD